MVKKKAESVIKIYPEDLEWLRDEQYRRRKAAGGGKKANQPEIIAELIAAQKKRTGSRREDTVLRNTIWRNTKHN